jgi:hydrogenase nickel incorporation protein HypA/HybF
MHEMAIAQSVLDIAFGEAQKHASNSVKKIKLNIGEFSGVVREALEFAFDVLKHDTLAESAEIEIEVIKLRVACESCGEIECSIRNINLICPNCKKAMRVNAGREMKVEYLDLE